MILEVKNVSKSFRGLRAVKDASFELSDGEINGLIGPNGAGKTTIFNMIAGVYAPDTAVIAEEMATATIFQRNTLMPSALAASSFSRIACQ